VELIGDWQETTIETILLTSWIVKRKTAFGNLTPIADFRLKEK